MKPGLSVSLVLPILNYLVREGYDPESFCRQASFDRGIFQDADARIREEELDRLLDAAAGFAGDKHLGLRMGQMIEVSSLGILGYVLLNSGTIEEALLAYRRYNVILCSGIEVEWETIGDETRVGFKVSDPDRLPSRHAVEGIISSLYHILVKLSCCAIRIKQLLLTHSTPDGEHGEYLKQFGVQPRFGSEKNVLSFASEVMRYPVILSNRELLATVEACAEETRSRLLHGRTLADQVSKWIAQCMPATFPGVKEAARHFNVSVRTLQVSLQQEETTYQILFNKSRLQLAGQYLRSSRYTVAEVAYLLQYSAPSAFQNAFKKWTGQTPKQFRESGHH